jgi:hypothetical protein
MAAAEACCRCRAMRCLCAGLPHHTGLRPRERGWPWRRLPGAPTPRVRASGGCLHGHGYEMVTVLGNMKEKGEGCTTGIWIFAECRRLCRVLFIEHSTKTTLPSAAFGKVLRSVKILFTECRTLGTAKHSAKMALGKGPLAAVYS